MSEQVDKAANFKLTRLEQLAVQGVQAREREIQTQFLAPLQSDFNEVLVSITSRLGLEPDAFGKTHKLDLDTFTVVAAANASVDNGATVDQAAGRAPETEVVHTS